MSADEILARQLQEEEMRMAQRPDGTDKFMGQLNSALDTVHRVRVIEIVTLTE